MRRRAVAILIALAVVALGAWHWSLRSAPRDARLVLYGNVDIRQVDLAFNAEGRLAELAKQEGDRVTAGEVVALLDDETYRNAARLAEARLDAQRAVLARLEAGSRPEEIARARADVLAGRAALVHAEQVFERRRDLAGQGVVARQAYDDSKAELDGARQRLAAAEQTLRLAELGPRAEDIAQARAQVRAEEAALALVRERLERTRLKAPSAGVVLARVLEPGAIVLPTSTVYTLALTDQVWVRTYVPQSELGRAAPGTAVQVLTDSRPSKPYGGWIGYVAPTAEFTPKTVETPELRTQLVYRLRVHVREPDDALRQGMPVTVLLPAASGG